MSSSIESPGAALAEELRRQSEEEAAVTPMGAVLDAARKGFGAMGRPLGLKVTRRGVTEPVNLL
jgi:hypothetical protein